MKKLAFLILLMLVSIASSSQAQTQTQTLYNSFRDTYANSIKAFVFVSIRLSDTTLIALARDARRAGVTLVLNGFIHEGPLGLEDTKAKVSQINAACCGKSAASWQINPLLFQRYKVTRTPTFLIARGNSDKPEDYSKISGEMSLPTALKYFAQESKIPDIKRKAGEVYLAGFAEKH